MKAAVELNTPKKKKKRMDRKKEKNPEEKKIKIGAHR